MNKFNKYDDLEAPWKNNPTIREGLLQRIRQSAAKQHDNSQSLFTEENISEQYYRMWLELPSSAVIQKVAQHPLLTKKSKETINEKLQDQKMSHLKWASGGSAVILTIYSLFMSRMAGFRNFFNNQNSYLVTRVVKKSVGVYGVFLAVVASMTSTYEKQLPGDFQQAGLLKQYGILNKTPLN